MSDDLVKMARAAMADERLSDGALPIDSGRSPLKGANKVSDEIDRKSVERLADCLRLDAEELEGLIGIGYHSRITSTPNTLLALRAALDAAEATSARIVSAYRINMMRHTSDYSHEAFDQHIAALQENPDG